MIRKQKKVGKNRKQSKCKKNRNKRKNNIIETNNTEKGEKNGKNQ